MGARPITGDENVFDCHLLYSDSRLEEGELQYEVTCTEWFIHWIFRLNWLSHNSSVCEQRRERTDLKGGK